jgi:oligoendopeptidase F
LQKRKKIALDKKNARTYDRYIDKGNEKEEYTYTLARERNPSAVRFLGERYVEGSF